MICSKINQSPLGHCIYNTMISPEEKIYSPQSKTPSNAKDDVPKQFAYVEPNTSGPRCLKKQLIGCAIALMTIVVMAIVAIVTLYGDPSKLHSSIFFSKQIFFCKM